MMFKKLKDTAGAAFDKTVDATVATAKSATTSVTEAIGSADKTGNAVVDSAKSVAVWVQAAWL